jgi:hypothetical protein
LQAKTRKIAIFARKCHLTAAAFTMPVLTMRRRYEKVRENTCLHSVFRGYGKLPHLPLLAARGYLDRLTFPVPKVALGRRTKPLSR